MDKPPSAGPGRLWFFDATIGCLYRAGFPHAPIVHALSALVQEHVRVDGYDEEEAFAFGLDLVLDDLERRLALALRPIDADA